MRATLDGVEGMAVVAEARDERSLRAALAAKSPDLVVLDMAMPGREFGELIPALKREWPATRFMIVMADAHEMDQMRLEAAGADGIFIMDRALSDLVVAANRALHGLPWLAGSPAQRPTVPAVGEPAPLRDETPTLTRRQRELLRLISNDYDNRAIARALDVSVKTVENHLTALYRTGCHLRLKAPHRPAPATV